MGAGGESEGEAAERVGDFGDFLVVQIYVLAGKVDLTEGDLGSGGRGDRKREAD